jgi:hypothetical protein
MKKSTRPRKGKIINGWTVFGIYEILAASAGPVVSAGKKIIRMCRFSAADREILLKKTAGFHKIEQSSKLT